MDPARLEDRLSEFIERREGGERLTPEDFAREHADGGAELLAALRALASTEALFPSDSPDLPARVGPYRVKGEIGRGGMGRVLEVFDPVRPEHTLALKLLHVTLAHQPRALERFRREGKALEHVTHPWIVRVYEAGLIDQRPFLAMERIVGTSLADHLRQARERRESDAGLVAAAPVEALDLPGEGLPLERVLRLVGRLARAMAAAHREGVLHRDLNPRNVLVRPNGEPVIIDFGLMRASGAPTLTGSGDLLGTPQYMAPEQARGERVDERSDIFGLGTILWELLTLAPPRTSDDTLALVREASNRPLPEVRRQVRGVSHELSRVVRRATSFFPRWRYASCEALATDLELLLEGESIRARAPSLLQLGAEFVQGHRSLTLASGALFLALGTGLFVSGRPSEDEVHRRRTQLTNAVFLPWLDGDIEHARRALPALLESESEPPFVEFLEALALDDLARASSDPATSALLEGERLRRAGRAQEALAQFRTAWDLTPNYPMVMCLQGLAALDADRLEAARPALEASTSAFGRSPRIHRGLAAIYAGLDLPADAARALNAVLALAPDDSTACLALARARQELGDETGALAAARRALELAPETGVRLEDLAREWKAAGATALAEDLRSSLGAR